MQRGHAVSVDSTQVRVELADDGRDACVMPRLLLLRQCLYFCTRKASKLSALRCFRISICTVVLGRLTRVRTCSGVVLEWSVQWLYSGTSKAVLRLY
jgi:hypothetical protein